MTIDEISEQIRAAYERLTGRPCKVQPFVVERATGNGVYDVHLLGTTWFYSVWRRP
jgi:hypothetical protein